MLKKLTVNNFAIIEDLTVEFNQGMTVLTGETGAGKSLIIDTIQLLLGGRADTDMIRFGQSQAAIIGLFSCTNKKLIEYVQSIGISMDSELEIRRDIKSSGKNTILINSKQVNLQTLRNIAVLLADVHVQNDTFKLFEAENYLDFIDSKEDSNFISLFNEYTMNKDMYDSILKRYSYILANQNRTKERFDFLKYELEELQALNLTEDIDIELETEITKLKNYDKIYQALNSAHSNLDNEYFSIDSIYTAGNNLAKIGSYDQIYEDAASKINEAYYILEDVKGVIFKEIQNMDFDEEELNQLETRLLSINKAKEKYKKNIHELIEYLKQIHLEIDMVDDFDSVLIQTKKEIEMAYKHLVESANKITKYRKNVCEMVEKTIIKECQDLDLANVDFEISFQNVEFDDMFNSSVFFDNGVDKVDFLISLNKGEPKKSLAKVASGGEMSRIMLAFKAYFSQISKLELMVFDEIDTGISGVAAAMIANKIKQISQNTQVLCITHLPQVAAIGEHHYYIYKVLVGERTKTQIDLLSDEKRIEQIAIMLSGNRITKFALEHAKELLEETK